MMAESEERGRGSIAFLQWFHTTEILADCLWLSSRDKCMLFQG